jgi:hypothetical protein
MVDRKNKEINSMEITLDLLKHWGACAEGRSWFEAKYPDGGANSLQGAWIDGEPNIPGYKVEGGRLWRIP